MMAADPKCRSCGGYGTGGDGVGPCDWCHTWVLRLGKQEDSRMHGRTTW
jgi:hypothetical protein